MQDAVAFTTDDFEIKEDSAVDICGNEVLIKVGLSLTETIGLQAGNHPGGNPNFATRAIR